MKKKLHKRSSIKKSCSKIFYNIHRKTLVLESLFTKTAGRDSKTGVSSDYCKILKNAYFKEHMWTTASETC